MIDVHLMVYLGVLVVFIVGVLAIGVAMVLVLTAAAVTSSVRGGWKSAFRAGAGRTGGQGWFWRQESQPGGLNQCAGPTQVSGGCPLLSPDDDLHTGRRRDEAAGAVGRAAPREIETWTGAARPTPQTPAHRASP